MAAFDWYECTFHETDPLDVIRALERAEPFAYIEPDNPKHGYQVGHVFKMGGEAIARVWWQGNPGVHVILHSSNSIKLAPVLRGLGVHQVTRLDACEDWIEPGLFDLVSRHLIAYAMEHRIVINQQGDWARGEARTLYLGSPQSAVRLVLYEKGYETGGDKNWVRLEVRVRPKGAIARMVVSEWLPGQAFGSSKWVVEALKGLGWDHLQSQSVGTVYRPSDDDRARLVLVKQYGKILAQWAAESRDPATFAGELLQLVADNNDRQAVLDLLATAGIARTVLRPVLAVCGGTAESLPSLPPEGAKQAVMHLA